MKKIVYLLPFVLLAWASSYLSSCKKDLLFSNENLSFSEDTVLFDTIFTTVGSTTKRLKIYNTSGQPVKVQRVVLLGGESSPFRVNLDGISGTEFTDFVIPANDSLFMFVEVTLGNNNVNDPLIIEDIVEFETNGKTQSVQLAAWGQDAYFHYQDSVEGVWPSDKPHVVYDYTLVGEGKELTIQAEIIADLPSNKADDAERKNLQLQLMASRLEGSYVPIITELLAAWIGCGPLEKTDQALLKRLKKVILA